MKYRELRPLHVSPDAEITHSVQSSMVFGSAVVGGPTIKSANAVLARAAQPMAK
jgi:hypothetical protein